MYFKTSLVETMQDRQVKTQYLCRENISSCLQSFLLKMVTFFKKKKKVEGYTVWRV